MEKKCVFTTLQIIDCVGRRVNPHFLWLSITESIHKQRFSYEDKRYVVDNVIELSVKPSVHMFIILLGCNDKSALMDLRTNTKYVTICYDIDPTAR